MKTALAVLLPFIFSFQSLYTQHLPHKLDNQWHYDRSTVPGGTNYAAIVTERTVINGINYWKIDRFDALTGAYLETVYDRTEGDSLYIRKVACPEELIINFDWPLGYIEVTATGNDCYTFRKLINKFSRDVFGINTMSYQFQLGEFCEGYTDTVWVLFAPEITKELGCYWANDGKLVGAVINGATYGTLYPLPVELINFSASQYDNSVQLKWQTASETNNSGYEILKKKYETEDKWDRIAFIEGSGTTSSPQTYSYQDNKIENGTWFYRIMQYDYDGTSKLIAETPVDIILSSEQISLQQNYPNPFNPSTIIEYRLTSSGSVKLKVYDVMGREIATLIDELQSAGLHAVTFNGGEIASGLYVYTLQSGSQIKTGQMLLIR